ncbi:MAG: hypothetical protein RL885_28985 [Planctomycetota bacterium]
MWMVKNNLRGTLTFRGLDVSIPAGGEYDLDGLGRAAAEDSPQVQVAFEEGYLSNIVKEEELQRVSMSGGVDDERLRAFKQSILEEIRAAMPDLPSGGMTAEEMRCELAEMKQALVGDLQGMLGNLEVAKVRLKKERERVLVDHSLSETEIRARLAFLDEQGTQLEKNFERLGRARESAAKPGDLLGNVDLLSNI